jgi:hypothetical protein
VNAARARPLPCCLGIAGSLLAEERTHPWQGLEPAIAVPTKFMEVKIA